MIIVKDSLTIDNNMDTIPDIINNVDIVAVKDCESVNEYILFNWNSTLFTDTYMFKAKAVIMTII